MPGVDPHAVHQHGEPIGKVRMQKLDDGYVDRHADRMVSLRTQFVQKRERPDEHAFTQRKDQLGLFGDRDKLQGR